MSQLKYLLEVQASKASGSCYSVIGEDGEKLELFSRKISPETEIFLIICPSPVGSLYFRWAYTHKESARYVCDKLNEDLETAPNPMQAWIQLMDVNFTPNPNMHLISERTFGA